uniref:Intraflagellar transport protein 57 homolog n=1 Tax=Leptocylindrus danicus TaxID=163516 RepID=A0A7S2KSU8_9STRA|mmetsp:Transcript_25835/g.38621  ORF Transcript_25835/g.38621 Transcript_25835/m.38621 type:complete len:415 (+) Transcript_25835:110-1354(+)
MMDDSPKSTDKQKMAINPACFAKMDIVVEKLRALDYESLYVKQQDMQPLRRDHFAVVGVNSVLQFQEFIHLAAWLINVVRDGAFRVDEFDDPNSIVHKLMLELQIFGFECGFPASRLKHAYGEAVIEVVDFLADQALQKINFRFQLPNHKFLSSNYVADEIVGDDDILEEVENVDEESHIFDDSRDNSINSYSSNSSSNQLIGSCIDPIEWKAELERVGPSLRAAERSSPKNRDHWRQHVDQMIRHDNDTRSLIPSVESGLLRFSQDLADVVDRVRIKESHLNDRFSNYCNEYNELKEKLTNAEKKNIQYGSSISTLSNEYIAVTNKLKDLKGAVEMRGSSMTDTTPLMRIKEALQLIKADIKTFDLQIGIVENALIHAIVQQSLMNGYQSDNDEHSSLSCETSVSSNSASSNE